MIPSSALQKVLSGSSHANEALEFKAENGYLVAAAATQQPLCGNSEGWGPLSPIRYDFTPCFLDVWMASVAVFGFVFGLGALIFLLKKRMPHDVPRNWHFWTKITILVALLAATTLQGALQIEYYTGIWFGDFRFWTTVATFISISVILGVQYTEHYRSHTPNGVVLVFWVLFIVAQAVKLRSLISQQTYKNHVAYFAAFCASLAFAILELSFELLVPKQTSDYQKLAEKEQNPYENANIFSILAFSWMTPMMKYGYKHYLTQDDMWNLRSRDTTEATAGAFKKAWEHELQRKKPSLWLALGYSFGGAYLRGGLFKTISDCLQFLQPQLLKLLISFVSSYKTDSPQPVIKGAAIALAMFATSVGQTCFLNQYFARAFETGMRIKAALTSEIYSKSMRLSNEGRSAKSSGDIVNLMSVDTMRLQDLTQFAQMLWSAPFQIVLCMTSLYQLTGLSMLAGIGVMIVMIPVNGLIARIMKTLQKRQMNNKDARTRLMTEILNNMKSIKLYAWTTAFLNKLHEIRNNQELRTLRKIGASQAFANFSWSTTPFLVSCLTFTVFVLTQKEPLTVDIVFPALTLFNLLTFPLTVLPLVVTSVVEASVAVNRLTEFFLAEEIQPDAVTIKPAIEKRGEDSVRITAATFTWNKFGTKNALEDMDFAARSGELCCIVGRVGAGKSSLLQSLLGDLWKVKGEVVIRGKCAYVAQSPWIMNASVKENILFGHKWDPHFYDRTVKACALTEDFTSLPDGDNTEVGERGISLSGGQKARLTLARAVYARSDIYLLDDVLSAVDQHVGRHLINEVLGPRGLLSSKTRVLATNSIPVLYDSDNIVLLRDGRISEQGTYADLMNRQSGEVASLIRQSRNEGSPDEKEYEELGSDSTPKALDNRTTTEEDEEDEELLEEGHDGLDQLTVVSTHLHANRKTSSLNLRRASTASFHGPRGKVTDDDEEAGAVIKTRQSKEVSEQGKVKWSVYMEYAKTSNLFAVGVYLFALIASQTAQIGGNVWLKQWAEANGQAGGNANTAEYIGIYAAFGIGSAVLVVIQTLILWIFCSIEASRKLHERMAFAMFRSPMSFFETTPAGRILNRFSSDIYRVDEVVARSFNLLFNNAARAIFTLTLISVSTPIFITLIIPLAGLYLYVQRYYLRTSRELKRLDSVSRSPIFAHFQESLSGISTIRAYRQQMRFSLENEWRVDTNLRAYYPSISANRWLAVRLEFLGSIIIISAAGFAIISVTSGSGLSAGLVGLAMSYALQITHTLNWIVRQSVEVETNIVSVERVLEYSRLPSEAPEIIPKNRPPSSWPANGAVTFKDFSTRYRPGLELVLRDINLSIKAQEKIGVVGRTGAGKSSLTLGLFRIIEPADGHISIDNINTSEIGLLDLRRRLAIIPQDAALFEGTVRDNLDPGHVHDDTELWSVLEYARLKEHVSGMNGKLEARIHEGGSNLSQGQRQLVSIARALLTPSNILVLDEATAAVDVETDALLQERMKTVFKDRTIITIAHRINTILDSDRILVLEKGRIAEFDTPARLIEERGLFYKLVKEAGLTEEGDEA